MLTGTMPLARRIAPLSFAPLKAAAEHVEPIGSHRRISCGEHQENEESLGGARHGEQVLEDYASLPDGEESERPTETWQPKTDWLTETVECFTQSSTGEGGHYLKSGTTDCVRI